VAELPDRRISDLDRERASEQLRTAYAEGRLDHDEFSQRLDHVYAAKTYGDLAPLTADLPPAVPPTGTLRRGVRHHVRAFVGSLGTLWGIWLVILIESGSTQGFWPLWVTVPWLIAQFSGRSHPHAHRSPPEELTP
jgi:uncharacterized membrane protein